ncbi:hypothetical protein N9T98_01435 [bacterium]|jgi:hypothetical protein|nr:hypothetical protein [bacterium]
MQDSFEPQPSDNDSDLPAPYNSPWKALGQDLRAVSADLRLRSQELWRRNREGDLSVPAFWPEPFAALFWPVLLGFSLAVLILGGIQLRQALQGQSPPSPPEVERVRTTPFPEARALPITNSVESDLNNQGVAEAPTDPNITLPKEPEQLMQAEAPPGLNNLELEPPSVKTEAELLLFDPLLELLAEEGSKDSGQGSALIVAAQPQPERNAVILQINDAAWMQRSPEQRQHLAETWWTRLEDQGYADLRLVNEQQDLLARPARIGGGMLVFDPKRV